MMQSGNSLRYPAVRYHMRMLDPSPSSPLNRTSSRRLEMIVSKQTTKVSAISSRLEWRVDHFEKLMKLMKNGQNLISKQFSCPSCPSVVWELHVYPNGKREEDVNNVSFFLRQVGLQRGEDPVMTEFQIYALDASDCRISVCRDTKDFSNQQGRGKFQVHRDKMLTALRPDGSLLLFCEVEFLPPGIKLNVEKEDDELVEENSNDSAALWVQDSMKEMWQQEVFTDCIIEVGTSRMNAHRCILAQHSVVFRSMFGQKSMVEAQNGRISITDSRPEYVRAMLHFVYTGTMEKGSLESFAEGILAIADKYAIMLLKEQCERYMASTICAKNIANLCLVADTYFASILKKACTKYISANHKTFLRSPEWKELKQVRGQLANDLLESVLDQTGAEGLVDFGGGGSSFEGTPGGTESIIGTGGSSNMNLTPGSVFSSSSYTSRNGTPSICADLTSYPIGGGGSSSSGPSGSQPLIFAQHPPIGGGASSSSSSSAANANANVNDSQQVDEDLRTPMRKRLRRKM